MLFDNLFTSFWNRLKGAINQLIGNNSSINFINPEYMILLEDENIMDIIYHHKNFKLKLSLGSNISFHRDIVDLSKDDMNILHYKDFNTFISTYYIC